MGERATSIEAEHAAQATAQATAQPIAQPARRPLWRNLSFTLMWTSSAASGFGDRMMMLAALALLGVTERGANATSGSAAVYFWFFLPYVFLSVPAGYLADRLPRKWLMLFCDEARGLTLLWAFFALAAAAGLAVLPPDHQWKVAAVLAATGSFAALFNPTRNAIVPQIIPRPQLPPANAIILGITVVASMVGLIAGRAIIDPSDAASVRTGLFVGAVFYLVSGTFFAFLKPVQPVHAAPPTGERSSRSILQGLRYIGQHRRVIVLIVVAALVWSAAAVVVSGVMGLLKASYQLQGDALFDAAAMLTALVGFGMLAGAILIALLRTRRESHLIMLAGVALSGLCVLGLTLSPWWWLTYLSGVGTGLFGNVAIVSVISLLQSICPNYVRGRVMGIEALAVTLCSVITYGLIAHLPDADRLIVPILLVLGPALVLFGAGGLLRELGRGPLERRFQNALWRTCRLYTLVWHRLEWRGIEHIPRAGPVLLAANHTTGIDPLVIQASCPRLVRWVMYEAFHFRVLSPLWRAIQPITLALNGRGGGDLGQVRKVVEALKAGDAVGIFPEGGAQRGHRELQPFKLGTAMILRRTDAVVVPVWIEGTPVRRNMLWHFLEPSHTRVTFGEPYRPDEGWSRQEVMDDLRARMLALAGE